jgi:hypothetical protein
MVMSAARQQLSLGEAAPRGFPPPGTLQRIYDDADLGRAVQCYRFFYPTVSGMAIFEGNLAAGLVPNKVFGIMDTKPRHVFFTGNSDTPYGPLTLDLGIGPMVVELPGGPLITMAIDVNQRWIADMGIPGPDAGKGGRHLFLPPGHEAAPPEGYHVWKSSGNRILLGIRSLPLNGDLRGALERIRAVKVRPLDPSTPWQEPSWLDLTPASCDLTPLKWEDNIRFWEKLHKAIDEEPAFEGYRDYYGELATLGIEKGKPFRPDGRMQRILEDAAKFGLAQLRAQAFADRRPDRVVWPGRLWEWGALRFENGFFDTEDYTDITAREKWFYQAIGASPAMFRRKAGGGSVYWLGQHDKTGAYLDGGRNYKLSVPLPVPGKLFWSVTVYDAETRSQIQTPQGKAALRSLFELKDAGGNSVELCFGPKAPAGAEGRWIQTIPGKGWFVYFRIYGPEAAAFEGSWKPGDFEEI